MISRPSWQYGEIRGCARNTVHRHHKWLHTWKESVRNHEIDLRYARQPWRYACKYDLAATPPTVTPIGSPGCGSRLSSVAKNGDAPVARGGETSPSPVTNRIDVSPGFPLEVGTKARDASAKIPGAVGDTVKIDDANCPFTPRTAAPAPT